MKVGRLVVKNLPVATQWPQVEKGKAMADKYTDQEFVENLVKALVSHPESVKTERTVDEMGVLITLHVHPEDMGYIIGRQGQTARAIRTLLKIVGARNNARVNLKIHEPEGSTHVRKPREERSINADIDDATSVIDDLKI